jgi:ribonuclease J
MTDADVEELVFLPLGGAGEIGMNLNLYGYGRPGNHRWLMIDCGVTFGGDIPGIDVMMPDPTYIVDRREHLDGLLLTHAHEDHLGAVPYLWQHLRCPVFATPFADTVLRRKLEGTPLAKELRPIVVPPGGRFVIGPFTLDLIGMTHSIPESQAVAIRTDAGVVLHTGDWKLDLEPVVGPTSDEAALQRLGDAGIAALICDSTNVFEATRSGSEGSVLEGLTSLIAKCPYRVAVACFASNIARLQTIAEAARVNERQVVISGASLKRNYTAARECGYLKTVAPFLDEAQCKQLARSRCLVICTGGQGEPRASLARIAAGENPGISLERGDAVIFSSRVIPGNEVAIGRLHNALVRLGVEILTQRNGMVHVSGHPSREELIDLYRLTRPRASVPVHGELRHLVEHAGLARELQVPEAIIAENGTVVRLAPGPARVVDHVPAGRLLLEGNRAVSANGELVRSRVKAIYNGAIAVTVTLDRRQRRLGHAQISTIGLIDSEEDHVVDQLKSVVCKTVEEMTASDYTDDEKVGEMVRLAVRRASRRLIDKRPLAFVHVVRA